MPVLDMLLRVTRGSVAARPPAEADACTFILRSNSGQFVLSPVAAVSPHRKGEVATRRFIQPVAACGEPSAVALSFRQAPHASANRPLSRGGSAQYQRKEKPR